MELSWADHKRTKGLTSRLRDYESVYAAFIQSNFPDVWKSWRSYDSTRVVFHMLSRHNGCVARFRKEMDANCDYLHASLNTENVLYCIHAVLSTISSTLADSMLQYDLQNVTFESLKMCAGPLGFCLRGLYVF